MAGEPSVRDTWVPVCLEKLRTPLGSWSKWGLTVASLGWSIRDFGERGCGLRWLALGWSFIGMEHPLRPCWLAGCKRHMYGPCRPGYPVTWNKTISQDNGTGDTVQSPHMHGPPTYCGIFSLKAVLECFNCFAT